MQICFRCRQPKPEGVTLRGDPTPSSAIYGALDAHDIVEAFVCDECINDDQVFVVKASTGSVAAARHRVHFAKFQKDGTICEVCDQLACVRTLSFSRNNAAALLWLYRMDLKQPGRYFHKMRMPTCVGADGEFSRMRFWDLIEEEGHSDKEKKPRSGFWRITQLGRDFVDGRTRIPKHFVRYNGKVIDFIGPNIHIDEGVNFNWKELREVDLSDFAKLYSRLKDER